MSSARAALILTLFFGGVVTGIVTYAVTDQQADANRYATLERYGVEPAVGSDIARALMNDDARALASVLDGEMLQQLQTAMEPLVEVRSAKFVGAVEKDGRTLAAYVAGGRDAQGQDFLVGFVLRMTGDQVTGVN